jgi:membrane-associated PAP2 superfamily phosphatase
MERRPYDEPHRPRDDWRWEALCLAGVACTATLLFAFTHLDIVAARWFYSPDASDHWPLARQFPWQQLYRLAPWITASLILLSFAALAAGFTATGERWRARGVFVLLGVVLAAGLLGNALFKDHWQHPRPRDLVEFGGALHYVPSPLAGHEGGASFPCGHCTVGFLYGAGWWIWKRRRPIAAAVSLGGGVALGSILGVGRMAAGAHFLSDIVWSALLAFAVSHLLYHHLLRIESDAPGVLTAASPVRGVRGQHALTLIAALGGVAVLVALFATPHGTLLTARVPLASLTPAPHILEVVADRADVSLVLTDTPASELGLDGELHGFGLPWSRLGARLELVSQPTPRLRYRIEARGFFTDVDGVATLHVPAAAFARVIVYVHRGDIRVTDTTRAGVLRGGSVRLELRADRGHVQGAAGH